MGQAEGREERRGQMGSVRPKSFAFDGSCVWGGLLIKLDECRTDPRPRKSASASRPPTVRSLFPVHFPDADWNELSRAGTFPTPVVVRPVDDYEEQ